MRIFLGILIFLFFIPKVSFSQLSPQTYEELKKDFQPLSGLIIGIEGVEVIIDKGRAQGVKPKDIWTIYKKVKKIVHPETKESLGFLKEPIGKIEILRVDENFATGRVLSKKEEIPVPTPVIRNTDLKILIVSEEGGDESLFLVLKNWLPESEIIFEPYLKLANLNSQELFHRKIDLLLVYGPGYLKVYNAYLDLVRIYGSPYPKPTQLATQTPKERPPIQETFPSLSPNFSSKSLLGKLPGEVLYGEFIDLDGDGKKDFIYFTSDELWAVKIKGGLLAKYKPEKGQILSLSVGPQGWIALNVYEKNVGMRSEILKFTPQGFEPVIKNLNLVLQFVDYVGTGIKDTLLVQTFDPETFYGKEVYIAKRQGSNLIYAQRLEVPESFRLPGSNFIDLDGDGVRELVTFLSDGRLGIYRGKTLVFSTPFPVSKHFYTLTLSKGKRDQEVIKAILHPMVGPILGDFNRDGKADLLLVKADFPLENVRRELKSLPLNQANFQVYTLSYQGTYYFRATSFNETGILTALGEDNQELYIVTVKGVYPGQTESYLYSILY